MGQVRVGLVLAVALGLIAACGDDDDSSASPGDAGTAGSGVKAGGGGSGGIMLRDPSGGKGGGGDSTPLVGTLTEGQQCSPKNGCVEGLMCLDSGIQNVKVTVCSRFCNRSTQATDCQAQELCKQVEANGNGYCVNIIDAPFEKCGPNETALCDEEQGLSCDLFEDDDPMTAETEFIGFCLKHCKADQSDADGGLVMGECGAGQSCLPNGVCATVVEPGGDCTPEGYVCEGERETTTCFPDDIENVETSKWSCHQLCPNGTCTTGECVDVTRGAEMIPVCI